MSMHPPAIRQTAAKIRRAAQQISADQARRRGLNQGLSQGLNRLESVQIDFNRSALLAAMNFLRYSRI
jgi:hypothetical protein